MHEAFLSSFSISRLPRIEFGRGKLQQLASLIRNYGMRVLLVTGSRSFRDTPHWPQLQENLRKQDLVLFDCSIDDEPSPQLIDELVERFRDEAIDVVVGIGGGSTVDAGKAIAGLLRIQHSVMDFLEGVGPELPYPGPAVPFIAVPTTAGTGSEATKNAVLSVRGSGGFKKSFRDEKLIAEYALLDPDLLSSCPASLIAANGMDAATQLLESYVSLRANPFTDALALQGLRAVRESLLFWYEHAEEPQLTLEARARMGYAALLSGITLAQVGLGSVHGLASPLGAFFPIPHGVACGTVLAAATQTNIQAIEMRDMANPAAGRYAHAAEVMCGKHFKSNREAHQALIELLERWRARMSLPGLASYGVTPEDIPRIVANARGSSMKTNPIVITDDELTQIVSYCL